jgi:hypothetical protein
MSNFHECEMERRDTSLIMSLVFVMVVVVVVVVVEN